MCDGVVNVDVRGRGDVREVVGLFRYIVRRVCGDD